MTMDKKTKILKIAFWIGAITDTLAAIVMAITDLRVYIFGGKNLQHTPGYRLHLIF